MPLKKHALLALSCLLSSGVHAGSCVDIFLVFFAHKPAQEKLWISPDIGDTRLQMPLRWEAAGGRFQINLQAKRISKDAIAVEFGRSAEKENTTFTTNIQSREGTTQALSTTFIDDTTGDQWSLRLLPVCGGI